VRFVGRRLKLGPKKEKRKKKKKIHLLNKEEAKGEIYTNKQHCTNNNAVWAEDVYTRKKKRKKRKKEKKMSKRG
jgi:hypothetical protein